MLTERAGTSETRRSLVDAAKSLIETRGLANLTTRAVTREAGCSEGALYTHFPHKADLLFAVCQERLPDFRATVGDLIEHVGRGSVPRNLEAIIVAAQRFYADLIPVSSGIAADRELLLRHREHMKRHGVGPRKTLEAVATYIAAEQRIGRIDSGIAPQMYATMLLGACLATASAEQVLGESLLGLEPARFARLLARALWEGMAPRSTGGGDGHD